MPSDPAEILKVISAQHQLLSPDIKPWHMVAKFQLFDAKGNPAEAGTFEEFYAGPHKQKITYTTPALHEPRREQAKVSSMKAIRRSLPMQSNLPFGRCSIPSLLRLT